MCIVLENSAATRISFRDFFALNDMDNDMYWLSGTNRRLYQNKEKIYFLFMVCLREIKAFLNSVSSKILCLYKDHRIH